MMSRAQLAVCTHLHELRVLAAKYRAAADTPDDDQLGALLVELEAQLIAEGYLDADPQEPTS